MSKTDRVKFVHLIKKMYHYSLYNGINGNNGSSFCIYIAEIKINLYMKSCKKVFGAHYAPLFFYNGYEALTVIVISVEI